MIKVCGMRDAGNIRQVEALGIDMMGFIFWPKSTRYVAEPPAYLPERARRVGVFVDEDIEIIKKTADVYALDDIQLHGHETPEFARQLNGTCSIIKAFNIATASDLEQTKAYEGLVDYFLFDTKALQPGGHGMQFDRSILTAYDATTPFLLSGGIGPADAKNLRRAFALDGFPVGKCLGIDLNSRFESAPALKDVEALRHFLQDLKS